MNPIETDLEWGDDGGARVTAKDNLLTYGKGVAIRADEGELLSLSLMV